jgi:hypothetical protein
MKRFSNIAFSLVCLVGFELSGLAQSSTITTYAGIGHWPVSGTQAITQPIGTTATATAFDFLNEGATDAGNRRIFFSVRYKF